MQEIENFGLDYESFNMNRTFHCKRVVGWALNRSFVPGQRFLNSFSVSWTHYTIPNSIGIILTIHRFKLKDCDKSVVFGLLIHYEVI